MAGSKKKHSNKGVGQTAYPFTTSQIKKLEEVIRQTGSFQDLVFFYFLVYSGARLSEIINLRRKDVVNENSDLLPSCRYVILKKRLKKHTKHKRKIYFNEFVIETPVVKSRIEKYIRENVRKGYSAPESLIFPGKVVIGRRRQPLTRREMFRRFNKYFKACDFPDPGVGLVYGFHSIRKFHSGDVIDSLPKDIGSLELLRFLQIYMGHVDINTTIKYITARFNRLDMSRKVAKKYGEIFTES